MVEAAANASQDYLIDGLSFKMKEGATYVNDRKSVTYHPQGSNVYTPDGTRLIKLLITGDNWMDPSTFRVMFDLVNTYATVVPYGWPNRELRPLAGPYSFFKRMRLLCNGQIVEDIDDFNRVSHMFSLLESPFSRVNKTAEAFGEEFDLRSYTRGFLDKQFSWH